MAAERTGVDFGRNGALAELVEGEGGGGPVDAFFFFRVGHGGFDALFGESLLKEDAEIAGVFAGGGDEEEIDLPRILVSDEDARSGGGREIRKVQVVFRGTG